MIDKLKALITEMDAEAQKHVRVLQAQQFLLGAVHELELHSLEHPPAAVPLPQTAGSPGRRSTRGGE
jgi:hypothetical protein